MNKTAILFPAFVREYQGNEAAFTEKNFSSFKLKLDIASEISGTDLSSFNFDSNNFLNNELKSQYISFIFSCELGDIIHKTPVKFDYTAGYSMGIYAMFYHTRSIGFEAGLMMIKKAYEAVMNCIPENKYGMGNIIGLDESDFDLLLKNEDAEVINVNGSHNFVLSGTIAAVQNILDKAKAEGALHTRLLPVGCPYHSGFIKDSAISFGGFINSMDVKKPVIPVVSCIDQRLVTSADEVKREIISNLVTPLNWMKTIEKIHTSGVSLFYECGAGESLTKLNRFIAGNHKTIRYSQFEKLIV